MNESINELILKGQFTNPHSFLGLQPIDEKRKVIRLWRPNAKKCELEVLGKVVEAMHQDEVGVYEYEVSADTKPTDYKIFHHGGKTGYDPYAFDEVFGELDRHLVVQGLHYELYNLLGATLKEHQGVMGVHFALWAPNAISVSLIGDFNHWDGKVNPMRCIGTTGVWEIFIPGLGEGEKYKFEVVTKEGERRIKTDPVAHYSEMRPNTASVVFDVDRFHWSDGVWLENRAKQQHRKVPINIYEVHLGSWQRDRGGFLNYRELASRLVNYCKKMHYTHVELIGVCEHPLDESWGYQVTGYFAPTSRYGTPEDFQYFVNLLHRENIGVFVDWVPAHFPTDDHSLARFDGTYLYEHIDPRQGYHPQWSTHIFNYGRWEVSNFLIASALFWLEKMHVDGLRVDAVASMLYLDYGRDDGKWIPNVHGTNINLEAVEFLKHLNSIVHKRVQGALMIAEESTFYPKLTGSLDAGGLGFDFKWSLGWMNDTFRFFKQPEDVRRNQLATLSHIIEYIFGEYYVLVLSHDEVVHEKKSLIEKMPGSEEEKWANLRLLQSWMICFPGKKLLFMGGEFGQKSEWNCKEALHWEQLANAPSLQLQNMMAQLNGLYLESPALSEIDFEWVIKEDVISGVLGYLRRHRDQVLLCIHHFCLGTIENYSIALKSVTDVREIFNSDRGEWGGFATIDPNPCLEGENVILNLPPLSTVILELKFS